MELILSELLSIGHVGSRSRVALPLLASHLLFQHQPLFSIILTSLQDRNAGLVKQVLASLPVRTIQRLTQTYLTLSLADIARAAGLAGPAEAEAVILRMVAHRQVFASINDRDGMVTFMQVRAGLR
jgi:hypothetical protein